MTSAIRPLLVLAAILGSCSGIQTHVNYREAAYDFEALESFKVDSPPSSHATTLSSWNAVQIARRVFEERGLRWSDDAPDFVLTITPTDQAELSGWLVQRRQGQVLVKADAFDPDLKRVFWRGEAVIDREPNMLPADVERRVDEVITALLRLFPR